MSRSRDPIQSADQDPRLCDQSRNLFVESDYKDEKHNLPLLTGRRSGCITGSKTSRNGKGLGLVVLGNCKPRDIAITNSYLRIAAITLEQAYYVDAEERYVYLHPRPNAVLSPVRDLVGC